MPRKHRDGGFPLESGRGQEGLEMVALELGLQGFGQLERPGTAGSRGQFGRSGPVLGEGQWVLRVRGRGALLGLPGSILGCGVVRGGAWV